MEAIAAFSLACNVIQVVDFGLKAASMCQAIYRTGQVRPELQDVTTEFRAAYSLLQQSPSAESGATPEDQAMIDLGRKCDESAGRLLAKLSKLEGPRGQKFRALGRTVKVLWESSRIEELQKQFESYRRVLETRILVDMRHRHNLVAIKQSEGFDHIGEAVQRLIIRLENGETRLEALVTNQHNETRGLIASKIDELRLEINNGIDHKEVLKSLHFPELVSRQENISDTYGNTFKWILDPPEGTQPSSENHARVGNSKISHPSLLEWLKTGNGVYWICGKAGSGKSTLMRHICEDERTMRALRLASKSSKILIIEYFFWLPGSKLQKSIVGLLRAILFQLIKAEPTLAQLCVTEAGVISAWTEKRLVNLLYAMASQKAITADLCIFVDGLDELDGDIDRLLTLIHTVSQIPNVKCVVSSRPWRIFSISFDGRPQLHLQDLTQKDIEIFVEGKLDEMQTLFAPGEIFQLVSKISRNADGVFLWVTLATASVLDGIRNGDNYVELGARLEELPRELNDLYDTLLSRIGPQYRIQAMRYFQLLLLDNGHFNEQLSILILSLVDLKVPQLSGGLSRDGISDTINSDAIIKRCNQTMIHLLQRCGGLLHLQFTDKKMPSQIPGMNVAREKKIPTQVKSLAEADALLVNFLHRTVFDYIQHVIAPIPDPKSLTHRRDSTTHWHPTVARAEAELSKITVMCEAYRIRRKVRADVLEGEEVDFTPEIWQLAKVVAAIYDAEQLTSRRQDELLIKIDIQGSKLMGLVVEFYNLEYSFCWAKLLVSSSGNFDFQVFNTALEFYNFAGFDNFVMEKLMTLSPEDCNQKSTELLPGALHFLTFVPEYRTYYAFTRPHHALKFAELGSHAHIVMALLNAGADPNIALEDNEGSLIQERHTVQPRSTVNKDPLQLTAWSFLLTMLSYDFHLGQSRSARAKQWHGRHHLDLWRDLIMVFVEKGADIHVTIPNFAVAVLGGKTVSNCPDFLEFEFTFILDCGALPILKSYFFDEKPGRGLIENMQSSNVSSDIRIKCLQLNIFMPPQSSEQGSHVQRSVTIENMARLLGLPKEAAVFQEKFELERPHPRGRVFSWEVSGMLDHLGSDIMRTNRPIWAEDEEEYSSLWDPAGGNVIRTDDPLDEPSETPSFLPKVLTDVMEILNHDAESGRLEQSKDFSYYNMDHVCPKSSKGA